MSVTLLSSFSACSCLKAVSHYQRLGAYILCINHNVKDQQAFLRRFKEKLMFLKRWMSPCLIHFKLARVVGRVYKVQFSDENGHNVMWLFSFGGNIESCKHTMSFFTSKGNCILMPIKDTCIFVDWLQSDVSVWLVLYESTQVCLSLINTRNLQKTAPRPFDWSCLGCIVSDRKKCLYKHPSSI